MGYQLQITATNAAEMKAAIKDLFEGLSVPQVAVNDLNAEPLNELVERTRKALTDAGFVMEVTAINADVSAPKGKKTSALNSQTVNHSSTAAAEAPETQPETPEVPKQSKKQVEALKRLAEGSEPGPSNPADPETIKAVCLPRLKELYKTDPKRVNGLLKTYGDGEKSFTNLAPEKFKAIAVELGVN